MNRPMLVIGLLVALAASPSVGSEVLRFDMGSADSPVRDGFTQVTAASLYTPQTGFGWRTADGLRAHHHSTSREWKYNESRGREYPPTIYTNEVTCDTVSGREANSFLVDLPAGKYTVFLLGGLSAGSSRDYHWFDVTVGGNTETVKIPGPYRFEKRVFHVEASQKPLAIELAPTTDWLVSCVVVFPADQERQVRSDFLDALEREIYFLPPDVAAKWKETQHEEPRPMPDFSEEDRRRGYAVFARHWSEVVYPNTAPRACELNPTLAAFASLGEYEPVTVTVRPLVDLPSATLTAGNLRCGDATIPAAAIDVRWVRNMLVRPNYSLFFSYHVAPDVLEHRDSSDLRAEENQRFWVTVHVPDDAAPGVYEGALTFRAGTRPPIDIPLKLRVLPIRLKKNPKHVYGMYYRDPLSNVRDSNTPEANTYFTRKADWERGDMVEHGMTSHISSVSGLERDDEGNWTMDGAETERRITLSQKHGLADQPLVVSIPVSWWYSKLVDKRGTGSHLRLMRDDVPQSFFDEVTKMVEAVQKERANHDWPEFLYYPIDEPSTNPTSVHFMVGVLKAIKQVPGVRTYVTADPTHEQFEPMWPYVDVWCCQPFVFGYEKIRRLSQEKGIEFWCYPNHISGENDHTPIRGARMTWGYGFWKSGFKALIPWIYQASTGDPWNYLDGSTMDFFNRSTPEGRPIPVTMWEAYREGIDDGRYLYTLQQLVERGQKAGGRQAELAKQAEAEIGRLWDAIDVQEKYKYDDLWSGPDFDARRWLLATWILRLQEFKTDLSPVRKVVDLRIGKTQEVVLTDGSKAVLHLLKVDSERESVKGMVCQSSATLEVNGETVTLESGNYRLPVAAGGIQIDCPVTGAYPGEKVREFWNLEGDARVRLWPAGSPWIEPGTFTYPIRQRWMAAMTWFSNEPVSVVNGWTYYHAGMDFGATEGLTEAVSAIDGIVASCGLDVLPGCEPPVEKRADVVYLKDRRGWFYRYSHLHKIDEAIQVGSPVAQGQRIGWTGKKGASGGWSHLHFDIRSPQPNGEWGVEDSYAFLWQSYQAQYRPKVLAVARPIHRARTGEIVRLDGSRSWAEAGIAGYAWAFTDRTQAVGPVVERSYSKPGVYSEILMVVGKDGSVDYDFATIRVADAATGKEVAALDANYQPTQNIKPGDEVIFTSRGRGDGASEDRWNFGDGSPVVSATSNPDPSQHAPDGYAKVSHRFAKPGDYIVTVRAKREGGFMAMHRLHVHVCSP